jgi:hypothetical protein
LLDSIEFKLNIDKDTNTQIGFKDEKTQKRCKYLITSEEEDGYSII